jgi:hypothetical protein
MLPALTDMASIISMMVETSASGIRRHGLNNWFILGRFLWVFLVFITTFAWPEALFRGFR